MSKPEVTREEMLDYLGRWKHCSQADQCPPEEMKRCIEAEDAIRRLIEERGEWEKKMAELVEIATKLPRWDIIGMAKWMYEIQGILNLLRGFDLGKEKK